FSAATSRTFSMICACSPGVTPTLTSSASAAPLMRAATAALTRNFTICISPYDEPGCWESALAIALVKAPCKRVTRALNQLYEDDQHDHHGRQDVGHEALIAVADAEIAKATAASRANHCRIADQAHSRHGEGKHDGRLCLGQKHLRDDLHWRGPHGASCLDQPLIDLADGRLDQTGKERDGGDGQRYDCGLGADRRACQQPRERNDRYDQYVEWCPARRFDDDVDHLVHLGRRKQLPLAAGGKEHAYGQSNQRANEAEISHQVQLLEQ